MGIDESRLAVPTKLVESYGRSHRGESNDIENNCCPHRDEQLCFGINQRDVTSTANVSRSP